MYLSNVSRVAATYLALWLIAAAAFAAEPTP